MPDPPLDAKHESIKYVGASSLEGDPIHFTANGGAPSRQGGAPSRYASDPDDSGKAVVVEGDTTDVSCVTGKELMNVNVPLSSSSSSSSSSSLSRDAETQDLYNNSASGSSSQHNEAEDTTDEDTTDVPRHGQRLGEALGSSSSLAITPMNESDNHLYWRNEGPRLFEDTPQQANISSGLGNYEAMRLMGLPEEPQHDADLHEIQEPEAMLIPSTPIVTFQVLGFSMGLAGGIVPSAEEQSVEDPDGVGLENLDIFMNP